MHINRPGGIFVKTLCVSLWFALSVIVALVLLAIIKGWAALLPIAVLFLGVKGHLPYTNVRSEIFTHPRAFYFKRAKWAFVLLCLPIGVIAAFLIFSISRDNELDQLGYKQLREIIKENKQPICSLLHENGTATAINFQPLLSKANLDTRELFIMVEVPWQSGAVKNGVTTMKIYSTDLHFTKAEVVSSNGELRPNWAEEVVPMLNTALERYQIENKRIHEEIHRTLGKKFTDS